MNKTRRSCGGLKIPLATGKSSHHQAGAVLSIVVSIAARVVRYFESI